MTNSSQAVTASLTLSAFGQTVASSGSSTSAYGFGATSGYRSEGDAGLTLVGCRFYDAQVGRFISRDTYLDQAPYAYCDGDPVNAVDPSGHNPSVHDALQTMGLGASTTAGGTALVVTTYLGTSTVETITATVIAVGSTGVGVGIIVGVVGVGILLYGAYELGSAL